MIDSEVYWNMFEKSGNIAYYLAFKNEVKHNECSEEKSNADNDRRSCPSGTSRR